MALCNWEPVERVVVSFDICCSTKMLEDMILTNSVDRWQHLIHYLFRSAEHLSGKLGGIVHKFVGDGCILLFPIDVNGEQLLSTIAELLEQYNHLFRGHVKSSLQQQPCPSGLRIGIDSGQLFHWTNQDEYIGRPINVACRLQQLADFDNVAVVTNRCAAHLGTTIDSYEFETRTAPLGNVGPVDVRVFRLKVHV